MSAETPENLGKDLDPKTVEADLTARKGNTIMVMIILDSKEEGNQVIPEITKDADQAHQALTRPNPKIISQTQNLQATLPSQNHNLKKYHKGIFIILVNLPKKKISDA